MTDIVIRGDPWQAARPIRRPRSRLHAATVLGLLMLMGLGAPGVCVIHCTLLAGLDFTPGAAGAGSTHLHHHSLAAPALVVSSGAGATTPPCPVLTGLPDPAAQPMPQPFQEMTGAPALLLPGGGPLVATALPILIAPLPLALPPLLRPPIFSA